MLFFSNIKTRIIMVINMRNVIKNMPLAVSGTLLAILSLGNLLNNYYIKTITFSLGLLIIIILLLKAFFYRESIIKELTNPIVLSTSGTFSMALMVLSTYIINYSYAFAMIIWISGVLLHVFLIIYYTYYYVINNFDIENYYGSLWVVYIGLTMAAISGGILELTSFSWIFFVFGFCVMIPTTLLVSYRYINYPVKIDANKPLICIYTAIFNILTVGYYYTFNPINNAFITLLYMIGLCLYVFSLYEALKYIKLPFYPSFSAFTFPFVISAISSSKMTILYNNNIILSAITVIETIIAIIFVLYVLYQYFINIVMIKS